MLNVCLENFARWSRLLRLANRKWNKLRQIIACYIVACYKVACYNVARAGVDGSLRLFPHCNPFRPHRQHAARINRIYFCICLMSQQWPSQSQCLSVFLSVCVRLALGWAMQNQLNRSWASLGRRFAWAQGTVSRYATKTVVVMYRVVQKTGPGLIFAITLVNVHQFS